MSAKMTAEKSQSQDTLDYAHLNFAPAEVKPHLSSSAETLFAEVDFVATECLYSTMNTTFTPLQLLARKDLRLKKRNIVHRLLERLHRVIHHIF